MAVALATACDDGGAGLDQADAPSLDAGVDAAATCPGSPGCPCAADSECPSNSACIDTADGQRCAAACPSGQCLPGFACTAVHKTDAAGNPLGVKSLCLARWPRACDPCSGSATCASAFDAKGKCADLTGTQGQAGWFCAPSCQADTDCPQAYACKTVATKEGGSSSLCVPNSAQCSCSTAAAAAGRSTPCTATATGATTPTCAGTRQCTTAGLSACQPSPATAEACNGLDDDCNGQIDDGATICPDDGNPCTVGQCGGTSGCAQVPQAGPCPGTDDCHDAACAEGQCNVTPKPDGTPCTGGGACTTAVCQAGTCGETPKTDGTSCNDGDDCTTADGCAAGQCQGQTLGCDDGQGCTDDSCEKGKGCVHLPNQATCSDGDACTGADACVDGACKPGKEIPCDDDNVCTADSCDPKTGCVFQPAASVCDDGNACTAEDACSAGTCAGQPVVCDDGWGCTLDQCDPKTGCTYAPGPDPTCGTAELPMQATLGCGDPAVQGWQLSVDGGAGAGSATQPAYQWKLGPVPADLATPGTATCALQVHNGKDLACGAGQKQLLATATAPVIATAGVDPKAVLVVRFESAGTWPSGAEAQVQTSPDGKTWTKVAVVPPSLVWGKVQVKLAPPSGSQLHLRLALQASGCVTGGTGWFVRKIQVVDDQCLSGLAGCATTATCTMGDDGKATCACKPGYGGDGKTCGDVDECKAGTAGCDPNAVCTNVPGTFTCACKPGFSGDGKSCSDVDECGAGTAGCDKNATCQNTTGGVTCTCKSGWKGDGKTCSDVDECTAGTAGCDKNAVCANTTGGFTCACKSGWQGDGKTCSDVNECTVVPAICDKNATCENAIGSHTCTCKTGWKGDGKTCADVDECAAGTSGCSANATCSNSAGGFSCTCKPGYAGDGKTCTPTSATTCAAWKAINPAAGSGAYLIDVDGPTGGKAQVSAWCDMTTAGGPYTWVRINNGGLAGNQDSYAAVCAQYGMEVVVPRSKAHALAISAQVGGVPNLVNVFPKWNGATGLANWQGICQGKPCAFWLSDTNNAECGGFEPNGDNSTAYRLYRWGDGCSYGRWNDAHNSVAITGWVVCSPNDK